MSGEILIDGIEFFEVSRRSVLIRGFFGMCLVKHGGWIFYQDVISVSNLYYYYNQPIESFRSNSLPKKYHSSLSKLAVGR